MGIVEELSHKRIMLIAEIKKRGFVTKKTQTAYDSSIGFYINIWYLRDKGITKEDGYDKKNSKRWVLTEKGDKLAHHLIEIERIGEDDGTKEFRPSSLGS
jgi:predicted transcriptional regulator